MNLLPLLFIFVKMFYFINARELAYFIQNFALLLESRRRNPGKKHVVLIDRGAFIFICYFLADIFFLFYCIYLMSDMATWSPGCLLLIISAMESYAVHYKVAGAYEQDPSGYVYPKIWFKYAMSGMSMFILLKLFQG